MFAILRGEKVYIRKHGDKIFYYCPKNDMMVNIEKYMIDANFAEKSARILGIGIKKQTFTSKIKHIFNVILNKYLQ
jgi:hypothetical protein